VSDFSDSAMKFFIQSTVGTLIKLVLDPIVEKKIITPHLTSQAQIATERIVKFANEQLNSNFVVKLEPVNENKDLKIQFIE
jgi:hypothetical protein